LLNEDVLRLDVTVDHPSPVGVLESSGYGSNQRQRFLERELAFAEEQVAE
jgi:hypothetical protein